MAMSRPLPFLTLLTFLLAMLAASDQPLTKAFAGQKIGAAQYSAQNADRDREIAARFAPVFYQALGDHKRSDYITRFDFDGDWRGDNNWTNAEDQRYRLRAHVYFAVSETLTHFFVHYAVFHPRDYKGGGFGPLLSEAIREGVRRGGRYDPTGLSGEVLLAHENDMEGCLVVAAKAGGDLSQAKVTFVETLAHDRFLKYVSDGSQLAGYGLARSDGPQFLLYVEPKGHGITAYDEGEKQTSRYGTLIYTFAGRADDPEAENQDRVGYDLIPLYATLWLRARGGANETYGLVLDYGALTVSVSGVRGQVTKRQNRTGKVGAAFLGKVGAQNAARPPWGWVDRDEKAQPPGAWFFDPASTIKRHYKLSENFSTVYMHAPFVGIFRK